MIGLYLVASGLLVVAGVTKLVRPTDTARALRELAGEIRERSTAAPLSLWVGMVRVFALVEAVLGLGAIVEPRRSLAFVVALSYILFTAFVLLARSKGGSLRTCGCFGAADTPPTISHVVVDAGLACAALAVIPSLHSQGLLGVLGAQKSNGVPLMFACVVAGILVFVVLSPLARLGALRSFSPVVSGGRPE